MGNPLEVSSSDAHESNAQAIYIPVIVFFVLCPLAVAAKCWARMRKGGQLGADDFTIIASLVFALASSAVMIVSCQHGYGRHLLSIPKPDLTVALMYFFICQVTYKSSINLTKASILLLYLRVFSGSNGARWFKWSNLFLLACVACYWCASVVATIFQCTPIAAAFDHDIKDPKCIDNATFWYANAGFSISTDFLILILPMPLVYNLQIPRLQKSALIVVFALGIFVIITSCLRVTTIDIQATSTDATYEIGSTMWTLIEMNVAILCACLPQIRPLLVKFFPKLMPGSYGTGRGSKPINSYMMYGGHSFASRARNTTHRRSEDGDSYNTPNTSHTHDVACEGNRDDDTRALRDDFKGPAGIRKTVQCSVEFDDAP